MSTVVNRYENLLTVIINHNCNKGAIALKDQFAPVCDTLLIDSGSDLSPSEREAFDITLGNVYYNGLLNRAWSEMRSRERYTALLLITSDVSVKEADKLAGRATGALDSSRIGVYAPSAQDSSHEHMIRKGSSGMRKVTFAEGFCFAVRREILERVFPVDLSVNKIGHGVDMYLGFVALAMNLVSVVDDRIEVFHPKGSGYSDQQAREERDAWYRTKSSAARLFHSFVSIDLFENRVGYLLASAGMGFYRTFCRLTGRDPVPERISGSNSG